MHFEKNRRILCYGNIAFKFLAFWKSQCIMYDSDITPSQKEVPMGTDRTSAAVEENLKKAAIRLVEDFMELDHQLLMLYLIGQK